MLNPWGSKLVWWLIEEKPESKVLQLYLFRPQSQGSTVLLTSSHWIPLLTFLIILLIIDEFHNMHPNPFPIPPYLPLPLKTLPHQTNVVMETVMCHSVYQSIPHHPHIFACKCSLQFIIGLVWGLLILLHSHFWILTGTPPVYSVLPFVMAILQLWICSISPFSVSSKFVDGEDVRVGKVKAMNLGLGCSCVGKTFSSPIATTWGWSLQSSPKTAAGKM